MDLVGTCPKDFWLECTVPECERPHSARGLCDMHWKRWKRWGDPLSTPISRRDDEARFWSHVRKSDDCWVWTGSLTDGGYGEFHFEGQTVKAHRWIYERIHGPIPKGLEPDHLCRTRACVRLDHLEPVTRSENTLRGIGPSLTRSRAAAITHCPCGHLYDEANTFFRRDGRRECRECMRERTRKWRMRGKHD